jgi:hypothetical protein
MNTDVNKKDTDIPSSVDVPKIIERLKELNGLASDAEFARFLGGYERAAPGGWRKRNSLPWEEVFAKCRHQDMNYVIFGERRDTGGSPITEQTLREILSENRGKTVQEIKLQLAGLWEGIRRLFERVHGPLGPEADRKPADEKFS